MRRLWYYYLYLLIAWGCFRYFVRLPEVIEELWFKPLFWLIPLFWWSLSLPTRLQMFGKKWGYSIFLGLAVGVVYFILIKRFVLQIPSWNLDVVGVALATAITEELTFSGFVAGYFEKTCKSKLMNLLIVGVMVAIIRLPILLFIYRLGATDTVGALLFAGAGGGINAWIRVYTGNVSGSILARVGMNLAILG